MRKIIVDGKEIKIPLNEKVEIEAKESIEIIDEENDEINKIKTTKEGIYIQSENFKINSTGIIAVKKD